MKSRLRIKEPVGPLFLALLEELEAKEPSSSPKKGLTQRCGITELEGRSFEKGSLFIVVGSF